MIEIEYPTPPDFRIASDALKHIKPIEEIASEYGVPINPQEFFSFGNLYAKVDHTLEDVRERHPTGQVASALDVRIGLQNNITGKNQLIVPISNASW